MPVELTATLIAAVGVLLFLLAWRAVRDLPFLARSLVRLLLALVVLAPFFLLIQMKFERTAEHSPRPRPGIGEPPGAGAPEGEAERRARDAAAEERARQERVREENRVREETRAREAERAQQEARRRADEERPGEQTRGIRPPQAPPSTEDKPGAPRSSEIPQEREPAPQPAQPPPPPAPAPKSAEEGQKEQDWDVVPVFFGTDRAILPDPKRLQFSWERGRKLELGRALVTVPMSHKVPQVERPWVIKIPYFQVTIYEEKEDPKKHFTMQELKSLTKEQLLALVRERLQASARFKDQAIIFVHGYNTSFDNAVYRTAQIAYDLKFDGAPFLYSWPSGGAVASYTYDRESAGQSEPYLRQFLEMVVKETGAKSVSVIAHSMGNQPLLQVLRELKLMAPEGVSINQVISAAPDVDRHNFENIARTIQGFAKGVTLYAASNDRALNVSRRFHGGIPRAGDVPEQGPLVLPGIDTIDVSAASMDGLGINHSGYAENNALLNDIGLLIQTGERPPDKRVPILEKITGENGVYWRYPAQK